MLTFTADLIISLSWNWQGQISFCQSLLSLQMSDLQSMPVDKLHFRGFVKDGIPIFLNAGIFMMLSVALLTIVGIPALTDF